MIADIVISSARQIFTATDAGVIEDGSIAVAADRVVWLGPAAEQDAHVRTGPETNVIDATGCVVTPGFVDPHTHVVFAGSRPREFEWRLAGRPYLEIMAEGGGILATVGAVRAATEDDLVAQSLPRLETMLRFGVTTVEAKSGYGLDVDNELKLLRAIRTLDERQPVRLVPTFLGAHTVPTEHRDDRDAYVDLVAGPMLEAVVSEGLATACDVYIEKGVFDAAQARRVLAAARRAGLRLHVHAGQFADLGGPELAAELSAASADHLDVVSDEGLRAMAESGTVATLLPGACISLGHPAPRVERFLEAGVTVALATDCNPGTSYTENLPLMAFLAATTMGLPCESALLAITRHAARALGCTDGEGTVRAGAVADLVVHDASDWRELLYHFGTTHARDVLVAGRRVLSER